MQFLTGCFQAKVLVNVKPDGSGTVEQTITMSDATIEQMKNLGGGAGGKEKGPHEIDEEKLKEQATKMGEGVTFVEAKPVKADGKQGYTATFAFTDISKLKVEQMPNAGNAPAKEGQDIAFEFTKGSPATLTIKMPAPKKGEDAPDQDGGDEMLAMMQQMLKDMRVTVGVQVQGEITQTNASHRDGQSITLLDMELGKVVSDPAKFKQLTKIKDPTTPEAKAVLKTMPGMKVETENPITVQFK